MNEIEKKYIELVAIERISIYKQIADKENITEDEAKKEWTRNGGIDGYIAKKLGIDKEELKVLEKKSIIDNKKKEINRILTLFIEERRDAFDRKFSKFYNWYMVEQGNKCGYCETTQDELRKIFIKNKKLPLISDEKRKQYEDGKISIKRLYGNLEIERKDSEKGYTKENMMLACPLCNNAKSNLIDEESWKNCFVPAMKVYYAQLLKD